MLAYDATKIKNCSSFSHIYYIGILKNLKRSLRSTDLVSCCDIIVGLYLPVYM